MVDNRSAGFFGIGGGFNFKSGDISGTAAKTSDDKNDQGTEYFAQQRREERENNRYVDRSAQLRASLNSLAAINAAKIKLKDLEEEKEEEKEKDKDKEKKKKRKNKELLQAEHESERKG